MGKLIDGKWHDVWYDTKKSHGKFERKPTTFHHDITLDDAAGFTPETDRYHLYISYACPWACRTLIFRELKQLQEIVSVSVVHPLMLANGWEFKAAPGSTLDTVNHCDYLYQVYTLADPHFTGRVTVPVLWDKQRRTIVNNESAEIIRIFNRAFNHITGNHDDYYPAALAPQIDAINDKVYHHVNNGVYKCGFATTQAAYDEAYTRLFATLDELEALLERQPYLVGERLTEADWRLFTTLVRFDAVYVGHFKCNKQRIQDYPHLSDYLSRLYSMPGIAQTVNMEHIKSHYYGSHHTINPTGIVPRGPELTWLRA
jgi:putative glutathione S-transferase